MKRPILENHDYQYCYVIIQFKCGHYFPHLTLFPVLIDEVLEVGFADPYATPEAVNP